MPSNDSLNAPASRNLTQNGGSAVSSPNSARNHATVASPSGSGGSGGTGTAGPGASHSQRLGEAGDADTDTKEARAAPTAPPAATGKRKLTIARAGNAQSPKTPAAKRPR